MKLEKSIDVYTTVQKKNQYVFLFFSHETTLNAKSHFYPFFFSNLSTEPHSTFNRNGKNIVGRPYVPVELNEARKKLLGVKGELKPSMISINPAIH